MRHMAGREDQFTEQQARTVEVFAVRADKLSAKAKCRTVRSSHG